MGEICILEKIRYLLAKGKLEQDISDILYAHKCNDLVLLQPRSEYASKVHLAIMINKEHVKERFRMCKELLEQDKIPYAVVKGAVLSQIAYGDPYIRVSGDIDILADVKDIAFINQIMSNNGFVQGKIHQGKVDPATREEKIYHIAFSHQIVPFVKETGKKICPYVHVDINTNIFWGESLHKMDMEELLSTRILSKIDDISYYKLEPISEFISLCLHHYKDMNSLYLLSQGSLKLRLFLDIYRYIQHQHHALPPSQLRLTAERWGALPYVYYCLYQTACLFPDKTLAVYLDALFNEEGQNLINLCGLTADEQKLWNMSLEDRLFSTDFPERFRQMLDKNDIEKIELNIRMMQ